jgi:hypothetical protein
MALGLRSICRAQSMSCVGRESKRPRCVPGVWHAPNPLVMLATIVERTLAEDSAYALTHPLHASCRAAQE